MRRGRGPFPVERGEPLELAPRTSGKRRLRHDPTGPPSPATRDCDPAKPARAPRRPLAPRAPRHQPTADDPRPGRGDRRRRDCTLGSGKAERAGSFDRGAQYRRLATEAELRDQVARYRRHRGARHVEAILELPGGPRRTRSAAERELLTLLRRSGIESYETNARVGDYEVDFLWREAKLVVEVDGYDGHSGRVAFERDRLKAATLTASGLRVLPITGRQIRRDPRGVLGRILRSPAGVEVEQRARSATRLEG
jgi:very-short-patch-repair endonuclease